MFIRNHHIGSHADMSLRTAEADTIITKRYSWLRNLEGPLTIVCGIDGTKRSTYTLEVTSMF